MVDLFADSSLSCRELLVLRARLYLNLDYEVDFKMRDFYLSLLRAVNERLSIVETHERCLQGGV